MQAATAFDPAAGLERLLLRKPQLRFDPDVAPLLATETKVAAEILFTVQKLLVRPDLTIAIVGCFRPVLSTLVTRTVEGLHQLFERKDSTRDGNFIHGTNNWSMKIHEHAVMAFSRILELAPYLQNIILYYFTFAPAAFERLRHPNPTELCPSKDVCKDSLPLLDILRASYQFLHLEAKTFRDLWDWSPFLDLLMWSGPGEADLSSRLVCDVRWCALQVVSVVLRMTDATTRDIGTRICGLSDEETFECLICWEEFSNEIAVEKAGMFFDSVEKVNKTFNLQSEAQRVTKHTLRLAEADSAIKWKEGVGHDHVEICGIELPTRVDVYKKRDLCPRRAFYLTPTAKKALEPLVLALSQRIPVLLEGALGVGKSSLIYEVARLTGNYDVIYIHLDDETDIKTLFGNYVCTDVPGRFIWQPGPLTQAVRRGLWIVFEDIDRAPSEVISSLVPLLENRKLFIPGQGEVIHAADNFQMFATITRIKFGSTQNAYRAGIQEFDHLWKKVFIGAPTDEELVAIIEARFPQLANSADKILGTFNMLNDMGSQSNVHSNAVGKLSVHIERHFSTRDLMKWCQRIVSCGLISFGHSAQTSAFKERAFVEALDIFVGAMHSSVDRQFIMRAIAEYWDIPFGRLDFYDKLAKPSFQIFPSSLQIGRATLAPLGEKMKTDSPDVFSHTGHALRSLERIAMCVEQQEPILLVGETGTGKTTLVQHLARQLAVPLIVLNLSQQSDSTELLGGYKPVEAQGTCLMLLEKFNSLFALTFPSEANAEFLTRIQSFAEKRKWAQLVRAFQMAVAKVVSLTQNMASSSVEDNDKRGRKRKRVVDMKVLDSWKGFSLDVSVAERQVEAANTSFAFSFVEGALVKALRDGHWILLDEVNLAPKETLERLTGVLEGEKGTICLTERGDISSIVRSPNFRIFACMNPATDVGKRDLPIVLRNRFTEFYIAEMTNIEDLSTFVYQYLEQLLPSPPVEEIVNFYLKAREEANTRLLDGASQKPHYSLRSLSRALEYTRIAMPAYGFNRALYDGICMSFLTLLDHESAAVLNMLISSTLFQRTAASTRDWKSLSKAPTEPGPDHILIEQFWLETGPEQPFDSSLALQNPYILTASVKQNLKHLARLVFVRRYPVLLQGPTSSGKTSLIEYLANRTGHRFVRINNHEHTDLQEYLGTYMTDPSGRLVFKEGILVEAVRRGYWIVLDELNLAPPDVLEALNRLLDDNRELFIPELQQTIKPHPHFMLFATQNPPGLYGGRKVLSRAFRNRFMELHIDDIPESELSVILEKRCQIPPSHATCMVAVMNDLQRHRQGSKVFAGKHGFMTPRDLFRWAERHKRTGTSYKDLAISGYMLLAERLRDPIEKNVVKQALEKHMHVDIDATTLYDKLIGESNLERLQKHLESAEAVRQFGKIVWTKSMKRLFYLVNKCYEHREPTVLVGETGCGKTTVFQMLAFALEQRLWVLNCHQNTETADFLGGYRPVRDKADIKLQYQETIGKLADTNYFHGTSDGELPSRIEDHAKLMVILKRVKEPFEHQKLNASDLDRISFLEKELSLLYKSWRSLFVWQNGPLIEALHSGNFFLVDEISLAEDSVLERLNSVLEPKRSLVLAEKGGENLEEVISHPDFWLVATMNPGGDFGKRELSPALRNRFTEIFVPAIDDMDDIKSIVMNRLMGPHLYCVVGPLLQFWQWFRYSEGSGRLLSLRDLLSWICFINEAEKSIGNYAAYMHGAFLVLLDGMAFGRGLPTERGQSLKEDCVRRLLQTLPILKKEDGHKAIGWIEDYNYGAPVIQYASSDDKFGIHPFYIDKGSEPFQVGSFKLAVPTTCRNALRVLRALQLQKPVLLEGSPGVGKTSLVAALGALSGHSVVRINLSEQTDIMDLFGSDMPTEGGSGGEFHWSDGIFLQALKAGSWVLLDELNLASQSVLEGLNSCLDHRGEVFIPELGRSFKCPPSFRVFACQNPFQEGGGRKGLPKSFLNRFTKVFIDHLSQEDFLCISHSLHPLIPDSLLHKMVKFNHLLYEDTMVRRAYGLLGSPWEFNLRDILRWSSLVEGMQCALRTWLTIDDLVAYFIDVVYLQRLRTEEDRRHAVQLFCQVFDRASNLDDSPNVSISPFELHIGMACLKRVTELESSNTVLDHLQLIPSLGRQLECVMHCVEKGWLCILVGPPKSGKTSIIRVLASLTGNELCELSLSSATDTAELLGCFEQEDISWCWQEIVNDTRDSSEYICNFCLATDVMDMPNSNKISLVKYVLGMWFRFQDSLGSSIGDSYFVASSKDAMGTERTLLDPVAVQLLGQIHQKLQEMVRICQMREVAPHLNPLILSTRLIDLVEKDKTLGNVGRFEWVDGPLLNALKRGDWVVLENANLCSPAVLDRLNPLVEPTRAFILNERGLVHGKPVVVQAHPNFRLFLTVDPRLGEVSRAMRNRGVEFYMLKPEPSVIDVTGVCSIEKSMMYQDTKKLVTLAGIPGTSVVSLMCNVHVMMKSYRGSLIGNSNFSYRELVQWVKMLFILLERGATMTWSLHYSWLESYADAVGDTEIKLAAENLLHSFVVGEKKVLSANIPQGWPHPLVLSKYCRWSSETVMRRNGSYVEFIVMKILTSQICAQLGSLLHSETRITEFLEWLNNNKLWAPYFPESLLMVLLNPPQRIFDQFDKSSFCECSSENLENMIPHAVFWMVEQTPFSGLNLYQHWLRLLSHRLERPLPILDHLIAVLNKELQHPAAKQIRSSLESLTNFFGNNYSKDPFMLVDQQFFCHSDSNFESGKVLCQFGRLVALRRTLLQWQIEDDHLERAHADRYDNEATTIQLSFWYHQQSDVSHDIMFSKIVIWLYPLLRVLRKVEHGILTCESAWEREMEGFYAELQYAHVAFWKFLQMRRLDVGALRYWWDTLNKKLKVVVFTPSLTRLQEYQEFMNLAEIFDGALRSEKFEKPLLWKYGGHFRTLYSRELRKEINYLVRLCNKYWGREQPQTDFDNIYPACANKELRLLILEGLSMIIWLDQEASKSGEFERLDSLGAFPDMANKEISSAVKVLCSKIESKESNKRLLLSNALSGSTVTASFWMDVLPFLNHISLCFDAELLTSLLPLAAEWSFTERPSAHFAKEAEETQICHVMDYSLKYSSRSPMDFVPHQHLLWIISFKSASGSDIGGIMHEMYFNWHAALWDKTQTNKISERCSAIAGAAQLFQASMSNLLWEAMDTDVKLKDYFEKLFQLRSTLVQGWDFFKHAMDILKDDLARASCVIQLIIYAHFKSFEAEDFEAVHFHMGSLHNKMFETCEECIVSEHLEKLVSVLGQSSHHEFLASLQHSIVPCLRLLYGTSWAILGYHDTLSKRGMLWVLIGTLRLQLLIAGANVDPVAKHMFRHSYLCDQLVDLELELKVREESMLLVRGSVKVSALEKILQKKKDLQDSLNASSKKLVPRPDAPTFQNLLDELRFFWHSLASPERVNGLINVLLDTYSGFEDVMLQLNSWQENTDSFSTLLAERFSDYRDVYQPIQLGIHEVKFGLSILQLFRQGSMIFSNSRGPIEIDEYVEILCHLMQYPRMNSDNNFSADAFEENFEKSVYSRLRQVLKGKQRDIFSKLALHQLPDNTQNQQSMEVKLPTALLRVSLMQIWQLIGFTRFLHSKIIPVLNTTFRSIVELWGKSCSFQLRQKEGEGRLVQFRSSISAFQSETELDEDLLKFVFPSYWEDGDLHADSSHIIDDGGCLLEEVEEGTANLNWSEQSVAFLQDSLLKDVVSLHHDIFMRYSPSVKGDVAPVITDEKMIETFILSYDTGRTLSAALCHALPAKLDEIVGSGHLLRLSTLIHSMSKQPSSSNIHKDPNPAEISKLLEPLNSLSKHISSLLLQWPEHPVLLQIIQYADILGSISICSPVMKAVTGVEMILAKGQLWEENAPKIYSLSEELDELARWVVGQRKQELASYPTLLDHVDRAHEKNADKLWFSLYSLLEQHAESGSIDEIEPVIESLEEYMLCSPLGEIQRRVRHILAFYGQYTVFSRVRRSQTPASRVSVETIRSVLFNIHHYYSHFSSILQESFSRSRMAVDTEMRNFVQLYKWDDRSYLAMATSSGKAHKKVIKVMRKYDELLKRPVSIILDQHVNISADFQSVKDLYPSCDVSLPKDKEGLKKSGSEMDIVEFGDKEIIQRWSKYGARKLVEFMKGFPVVSSDVMHRFFLKDNLKLSEKVSELLDIHVFSERNINERQQGAFLLEDLSTGVIARSSELQKEKNKMVKKKAFTDLLKRLKQIGFSYHRTIIPKDQRAPKSWFLQAPSDFDSLMPFFKDNISKQSGIFSDIELLLVEKKCLWERANAYYFTNLELLSHLHKKSLTYNKDLNLQEVKISERYAEHFLYLQQKQRQKIYQFSQSLGALMTITTSSRCFVESGPTAVLPPQAFVRKWLWKQKIFLDAVFQVSSEAVLFFKTCNILGNDNVKYQSLCTSISSALLSAKTPLDTMLIPGTIIYFPEDLKLTWPILVSEEMVKSLNRNFQVIRESYCSISNSEAANDQLHRKLVPGLDPLKDLLKQGIKLAESFENENNQNQKVQAAATTVQQEHTQFLSMYDNVITEILLAIQTVSKIDDTEKSIDIVEDSSENIQMKETTLEMLMSAFRYESVYKAAMTAIRSASDISNDLEISEYTRIMLGRKLGCMHLLLDMLQASGFQILFEYIFMHKSVAKLAYILLNLFISLYTYGYCNTQEEELTHDSKVEEVGGTGMGEGEGMKDVSEEIEHEDQLIGTEKDKAAASETSNGKVEKGIEMEEDFSGDMFDVSEDEASEESDTENVEGDKIESEMGDVQESGEVVDERVWTGGDEDVRPADQEKYEKDAPISGKDAEDVQLRGKDHEEDPDQQDGMDDTWKFDAKDIQEKEDDTVGDGEDGSHMNEEDEYEESSGLKPQTKEIPENLSLETAECESSGDDDDGGLEGNGEGDDVNEKDLNENTDIPDAMESGDVENLEPEAVTEPDQEAIKERPTVDDTRTNKNSELGNEEKNSQRYDMQKPTETLESIPLQQRLDAMKLDSQYDMPNSSSQAQISDYSDAFGASVESKLDLDHVCTKKLDLYPPTTSDEVLAADMKTKRSGPETSTLFQGASQEPPALEKLEPDPLRSLGDFYKSWKERIQVVSRDLDEQKQVQQEVEDELQDNAMEYEFVSGEMQSNSQALGAATEDQVQQSKDIQKQDMMEDLNEQPLPRDTIERSEEMGSTNDAQVYSSKIILADNKDSVQVGVLNSLDEASKGTETTDVGSGYAGYSEESKVESFVSIRVPDSEQLERSETPVKDVQVMRKEIELKLLVGNDDSESRRLMWLKYEHLTSRSSQELTEQLRLILEPTLATKLQGDYRSGKRINMKKVIPYVASDFRKDKIWLRRTKPSKRQYQVVIAIDDSRSMSESHCGHMALEALVTICRAMSQLEIGQMAVASFGEKGNVRLLHKFDQPFTSDAGIQILSQFSFKQDNTITDEPMVDLLHFLTTMLENASRNPTMYSSRSNLQQLVLIIADGRFHEKETLRRVIREAITRRQLLAFIILDNPQESLLDMQSVSFSGGRPSFSKYLDSFPFPYYILLNDMQSLPWTLANLLRQWFELMQHSSLS